MKDVNPRSGSASRWRWGRRLRLVVLCAATAVSLPSFAKDLIFEQAFTTKGEPVNAHFQAVFVSNGAEHRLEVWRDGERRIKRRTDDAADTYAFRSGDSPEFRLSLLDLKKKIHSEIDRSNLYRIGNFTDWFDLGHGLRHPKGRYRVLNAGAPENAPKAIAPCKWADLEHEVQFTHVCWSKKSGLPLLMLNRDGKTIWRIVMLDHKLIPGGTFEIHDEGFIRNDANEDIERD